MELRYWLEDNVMDYDSCRSYLDFEVEVFDFSCNDGETIYVGSLGNIPDNILDMEFVNIEFAGLKDARTIIFNVDSEL